MLSSKRNPYPNVVYVLGGPGAGKRTQCAKVSKEFGLRHINVGDMLRAERDSGSEVADMIAALVRNKEMVPKEIVVGLIRRIVEEEPNKDGFIIDGFPRSLEQAAYFDAEIAEPSFVVYIDLPDSELEKRVMKQQHASSQINNQTKEEIEARISVFRERQMPVLTHLEDRGLVRTVSGLPSPEEVYEELRVHFIRVPPDVVDMSKPQSLLDVEPIYCAEQIKIPPALPDILKEFEKTVIRAQPDDLLQFAADYFATKAQESPLVLTVDQLVALQRTMATGPDTVSRGDVARGCDAVGVEKSVVDHIFRFRHFGAEVEWPAFVTYACAFIAEDLTHTVELLFEVFGAEDNGELDREIFMHLFGFLGEVDDFRPAAVEELEARLRHITDQRDHLLIGFQHFMQAQDGLDF